jgi:hypothetical protein
MTGRAILAGAVCFVIARGVGYAFYLSIGQRMLRAAGHVPDTMLPTSFVLASGLAHLLGGLVAAWALHRIVKVCPLTHALVIGAALTAVELSTSPTLFTSPYWYDWPHVVTPLTGLVLGALWFTRPAGDRLSSPGSAPPPSQWPP